VLVYIIKEVYKMKGKFCFWISAITLLIIGVVAVGCVNKGATGSKALVGTWEGPYGFTWTFTGNKFTQSMGGLKQTVPYKVKGTSISTEYQGAEVEMEFEIDGDTLIVDIMGMMELEFERVK
jgi:hypothetical protein